MLSVASSCHYNGNSKMAKIVYRQMPAPRELSQQIPAPRLKARTQKPQGRGKFLVQIPGSLHNLCSGLVFYIFSHVFTYFNFFSSGFIFVHLCFVFTCVHLCPTMSHYPERTSASDFKDSATLRLVHSHVDFDQFIETRLLYLVSF